ncbi:hypothetical protein [Lactococcus ileimucosae]|uniref:hypothetical protein n=1 Tax=Lactococcus ileimucosae TaxID=2941329 RepID=UPI003515EF03
MNVYIASIGNKYKIERYSGYVPLKLDHRNTLQGKVYYDTQNTVKIETTLSYDVGQKISIGGYPIGGKKFRLLEVSITDNPVLKDSQIIERRSK